MASHSSIIIEYFDELPEIDKIEIVKQVIDRYEKMLSPKEVVSPVTINEDPKGENPQIIVNGQEYATIGEVFKRHEMKPANAYQKLRRMEKNNPGDSRNVLLERMVAQHREKQHSERIKTNPPLMRRVNDDIVVG